MGESWWEHTTIYQVYPRSFADSDGDGIGDLPGLIDHLDHLVELGVGTVWVSPFFASPQRDVGYDVSDYRAVAPEYGTVDDAQRLIDEAHVRGLRVLFDLVLNHTSDEHPWFVESRSSRDNPKADWYVWADGKQRPNWLPRSLRSRRPNNWRSELQLTPAWQWGEEREQWYLASFLSFQPDLNWRHPEVRAEMFDMIRMWLGRGVDGFRLDIFGSIMQDELLRDNGRRPDFSGGLPRLQTPNRTLNTDENIELAADLRAVCDEFTPERVLLGEVFGPSDVLRRYTHDCGRDGLHLVFLFDFLAARYDAAGYRRLVERYESEFAAPLQPTYVLENHDRTRSLSRVGGDVRKARVLATMLCTLRGVPVVYQGQEIGMTNRYIPLCDAVDPVPGVVARRLPEAINRRLPERLNRDEVRTPMQWNVTPGAGFCPSDVRPWLPFADPERCNVEQQRGDEASLYSWYRELLALRAKEPALHSGTLRLVPSDAPSVLAYERLVGAPFAGEWVAGERDVGADVGASARSFVIVCNLGDEPVRQSVPGREIVAASDPDVAVEEGTAVEAGAGGRARAVLVVPPHAAAIVATG